MAKAAAGDTVKIHYTGTLTDGEMFDSSDGRPPLEFTLGAGQVIPGFDLAVSGMEVGESKTVTIPADQAYGERRPEMVMSIPRSELPENMNPELGQQLQMQTTDGQVVVVTVTAVDEMKLELDANHALAGKDLTFAIELVEIG